MRSLSGIIKRSIAPAVVLITLCAPITSGATPSHASAAKASGREQQLEPKDGDHWLRIVPPAIRRLVARALEELVGPKP
jgi:hypothetical protein